MPAAVAKRLSLNEIRKRVAKFAVDYKDVTQEKQHTADFWKALIRCYGVDDTYLHGVTFEYPARRSDTGGQGFIDVFQPGLYLIEQKTEGRIRVPKGRAQSNAEEQASAYLTGGDITTAQMPRYVITSDFRSIQITDLTMPKSSPVRTTTFLTADLVDNVEAFLFLTGDDSETLIAEEQAEASVKAARLMADLYAAMTGDADEPEEPRDESEEDSEILEASILLTRLLFLMFGDDAGLWRRGQFQRFIEQRTSEDGTDLGPQLAALFEVLDTKRNRRSKHVDEDMDAFPYVNGAIFRRGVSSTMFFDAEMREALLNACRFDWSTISPAVFGSLFQSVKSKEARRSGGEHYTSEENILKTLRPMFLDDFRARLDAARTVAELTALHEDLANYRYVDPACGCGNFLIVAYREMRALELDLLSRLRAKQGKADLELDPSDMLRVRLDQFHGIEINWWPAKIAETAMFLVDHQANQRMNKVLGLIPDRLPIDIEANIHHANAITSDWETLLPAPGPTTFLFGNPPFVGYDDRTDEQRRELQTVWNTRSIGRLDYVTAWHAKAIEFFQRRNNGCFAFVTTNSICQGEPVPLLFRPLYDAGWKIKFAHKTFEWVTEAPSRDRAFVHCVIVGFDRSATKQRLFTYASQRANPEEQPVRVSINPYLIDAPDVIVAKTTRPVSASMPVVKNGSVAGDTAKTGDLRGLDGLVMDKAARDQIVRTDPAAAKYLRPYIGGADFLNGVIRYCLWMPDGPDPKDLKASAELRRRLANVRRVREASTEESTVALAATPYRFKHLAQPTKRYVCVPRTVSDRRPYLALGYLEPDHIVSNGSFWAEDPDGFIFAIGSSAMFMAWQRAVGGRIKSDPRFANTLVWNTFPLPDITATQRKEIVAAGKAVLTARDNTPGRTLAEHYDPLGMSPALATAHKALDKAVDRAFGLTRGTIDEAKRQQTLFTKYQALLASA